MMGAYEIAKAIGNARKTSNGWLVPCVCHDDRNPSLHISDGDDGKILVHCFANCDSE